VQLSPRRSIHPGKTVNPGAKRGQFPVKYRSTFLGQDGQEALSKGQFYGCSLRWVYSGFAFSALIKPIALTVHFEDVDVMGQAVEDTRFTFASVAASARGFTQDVFRLAAEMPSYLTISPMRSAQAFSATFFSSA
jgi:hypothetical protein